MQRVVREYAADFYTIAHARFESLTADGCARARSLAAWTTHVASNWNAVRVEKVDGTSSVDMAVGDHLTVCARVRLGALSPEEVVVELYLGRVNADGGFADTLSIPMRQTGGGGGTWIFEAARVPCNRSGLQGYTVRVMPFHPDEARSMMPGLIAWA
jgi:starch phosphorylase